MKEFLIEDFKVNEDSSVSIEYFFYSEAKEDTFTKEQIQEVFPESKFIDIAYNEWLENFEIVDCIALLKYFTREYAEKKKKVI